MGIELIQVSKRFDDLILFENLNLSFTEGEVNCLMGASGCGKTTLLHMLMGLVKPDSGEVRGMDGKRLAAIFQEDRLIDHFDAVANIKLVCGKQLSEQSIRRELALVGIEDTSKAVDKFSGGMRRRVAIVRAILAKSDVLLLDEPFKGLDETLKHQVIDYVKEKTVGKTVILVTHDKEEAQRLQARMSSLTDKGAVF